MIFQTQFNRDKFPVKGEVNNLPSQTIPDQSMTVKELMERHARGLPLTGERVPIYNGEEDLPEFEKMDLAERQEYIEANKQVIENMKADLNKKAAEKKIKVQPKEKEAKPAGGQKPTNDSGDDKHFLNDDQGTEDAKLPK